MGTSMGTLNHWEGEQEWFGGGGRGRDVTLHGADFFTPGPVDPWPLAKPDFPFGFVFCLDKKSAVFTLLRNRLNGDFSCTLAFCIGDTVTIPK